MLGLRASGTVGAALAILFFLGCAEGSEVPGDGSGASSSGAGSNVGGGPSSGGGDGTGGGETSCGDTCDEDGDGVFDPDDACGGTPSGEPVNADGCSDSQVEPALRDGFPPYGLTWTPEGDPGRPGGLTWSYTGIDKADLFHIYWVICDDPATPCGVSLDGPIDVASEHWQFSAADSDLPAGRVAFLNTTNIALADGSAPPVTGQLTVTIVDDAGAAIPFADLATLGVSGRDGQYGAEIPGGGFTVTVQIEVQDDAVWTPYLDYFDAASTPDPGPGSALSFGGSFYDE